MDYEKIGLVVCLTIFIVVGINAAIYALLFKGGAQEQIELLRRATNRLQAPWQDEQNALNELAKSIQDLKKDKDG